MSYTDLFKALGDEGYTGTLNDRIVKALRQVEGYENAGYNTLINYALENEYGLGSNSANFKAWRENLFTITPILNAAGGVSLSDITYIGGGGDTETGGSSRKLLVDLTALTGGTASAPSEGDVVIAIVTTPSPTGTGYTGTHMNTAGYVRYLRNVYDSGSDQIEVSMYAKVMGATPDTSVQSSNVYASAGATMTVFVYRGVDPVYPFVETNYQGSTATTTECDPPSITTTTDNVHLIAGSGVHVSSGGLPTFTDTNTFDDFFSLARSDTYASASGIGTIAFTTPGTIDFINNTPSTTATAPVQNFVVPVQPDDSVGPTTEVVSIQTFAPGRQLSAFDHSLAGFTDLQEDDVLIMVRSIPNSTSFTPTLTPNTSGWTTVTEQSITDGSTDNNFGVYWKAMGATVDTVVNVPANSPTGITNAESTIIYQIRGADTTAPIATSAYDSNSGSAVTWADPVMTVANDDALVIVSATLEGNGFRNLFLSSQPGNYIQELGQKYGGSGDFVGASYYYTLRKQFAGALSIEDMVFSSSAGTDQAQGIVIEIEPAPAA